MDNEPELKAGESVKEETKAGEQVHPQTGESQHDSPPSPISEGRTWKLVRVPAALHAELLTRSRASKVSIHALISSLLQ